MRKLRYLTAGESHGPALTGILEGLVAGLELEAAAIDRDLARRQLGYGRGGRMRIERDRVRILGGVRHGETLGGPIAVQIDNLDFESWRERMRVEPPRGPIDVAVPRPGHADLAGAIKYGHRDLRNVLERASARETAVRVALGAIARVLLEDLGVRVGSCVLAIHGATAATPEEVAPELAAHDAQGIADLADASPVRALDREGEGRLVAAIEGAQQRRDTVGGLFEVRATGVPAGLGSHVHWDRKLDGALAGALMSLQAIKGVEIGAGMRAADLYGSELHDPILLRGGRIVRGRNGAGGIEGGTSNGQPIVLRAAMKPIATLSAALPSVNLGTLEPTKAHVERSDSCAVPAAAVIGEALVCLELCDAILEKLGGDSMAELRRALSALWLAGRPGLGHVYLVGPMGVGKSTLGALLAPRLGRHFVDLDRLIEEGAGRTVSEIFASDGEAAFRRLEGEALASLETVAPAVVALGGGALLSPVNRDRIRRTGTAARLEAPPALLAERIGSGAARPLLAGLSPEEQIVRLAELSATRDRFYRRADLAVRTDREGAGETAAALAARLRALEDG